MKKTVSILFFVLSFCAFAENTKEVIYDGQEFESVELENKKMETRYREEEVDSTCTRKIPYVVNECGYETRYRQQCRTVPGHQDCRTVYDRVCRNVTRYRQECRNVGGGETCRMEPGREQCRTNRNGERRCRQLPPRRICDRKPSRRVCRDVPYTDRVCESVPRRQCDWRPSRRVCEDVPYQEHVCRDVTRYREEQYACKRTIKVPYQVVAKTYEGNIEAQFHESTNSPVKAKLNFSMNDEGKIDLKVKDLSESPVLILGKKKVNAEENGDLVSVKALYKLNFLDMNKILAPVKRSFKDFYLNETHLSFVMGRVLKPEGIKVSVVIQKTTMFGNNKVVLSKTLKSNQFKLKKVSNGTKLNLDLKQFDIDLSRKEHKVTVKVEMLFNDLILNKPAPSLKKEQTVTIEAVKD